MRAFLRDFPPTPVYQGKLELNDYLAGETDDIPNSSAAIEELLMLWLANQNPAFLPYQELFDDSELIEKTAYFEIADSLHEFFETQPRFGPDGQNLMDMLRSPAIAVPDSLNGQLDYIRSRWSELLGHYLLKLLGSLNLISEEERLRGLGPGPCAHSNLCRTPGRGGGTLQPRRGLDAAPGAVGQEHLRVAGPTQSPVRTLHHTPGPNTG